MTELDQIIDEIRHSRCRMSEECGHDLTRYIAYLKQFNREYAAEVERYRKRRTAANETPASHE